VHLQRPRFLSAALLTTAALTITVPAADATPAQDAAASNWCTSVRPVSGSVPMGTFHASKTIACGKCDEYARYLRAHGKITTYACAYTYRYPAHATLWARRSV